MTEGLALTLLLASGIGLAALLAQAVLLERHLRRPVGPRRLRQHVNGDDASTAISILKPLCGVDDGLAENLESFIALHHPRYELLLGVRDPGDGAYPLARALSARFPERVRVVLQRGEPGLNPKVNQLITLAGQARHPVLVVSDSNVRAHPDYLEEISSLLAEPTVGCVTHAVAAVGERTLGSALDTLHLSSSIAPGMVAAAAVSRRPIVVGKSIALRAEVLKAVGGFEAFQDHLAEDYVLGMEVANLGLRVVVAPRPLHSVSIRRSVGDFWRRYARWSVIHRTAVAPATFVAQALLNPTPLALLALALAAEPAVRFAALGLVAARGAVDVWVSRRVRGEGHRASLLVGALLLKDLLLLTAWVRACWTSTACWRGTELRVARGSRLVSGPEESARRRVARAT